MSYHHTLMRLLGCMLVAVIGSATPAMAEWFIDLYGGGGFVQSDDVTIEKDLTSLGTSTTTLDATLHEVDFDDMLTGGLRVGYWFQPRLFLGLEMGLSLDVFYFPLKVPAQTVRVNSNVALDLAIEDEQVSIAAGEDLPLSLPKIDPVNSAVASIELMLRRPFGVNSAFPHGRVQPYVTIAPALLFNDDNPGITVGVKAGAGLAWQVHKHVALLAEYRFTHFRFKTTNATVLVEGTVIQQPDIETDLDTHFLLAGISIRL